jgi:hypothetical protein
MKTVNVHKKCKSHERVMANIYDKYDYPAILGVLLDYPSLDPKRIEKCLYNRNYTVVKDDGTTESRKLGHVKIRTVIIWMKAVRGPLDKMPDWMHQLLKCHGLVFHVSEVFSAATAFKFHQYMKP